MAYAVEFPSATCACSALCARVVDTRLMTPGCAEAHSGADVGLAGPSPIEMAEAAVEHMTSDQQHSANGKPVLI